MRNVSLLCFCHTRTYTHIHSHTHKTRHVSYGRVGECWRTIYLIYVYVNKQIIPNGLHFWRCAEPTNDNELQKKRNKNCCIFYMKYMYILYIDIYVPHKHTCTCATDVLCDDDLCVRVCLYACAICCSS